MKYQNLNKYDNDDNDNDYKIMLITIMRIVISIKKIVMIMIITVMIIVITVMIIILMIIIIIAKIIITIMVVDNIDSNQSQSKYKNYYIYLNNYHLH